MLWFKIACEAGVLQYITPQMKREIDRWIMRNQWIIWQIDAAWPTYTAKTKFWIWANIVLPGWQRI